VETYKDFADVLQIEAFSEELNSASKVGSFLRLVKKRANQTNFDKTL